MVGLEPTTCGLQTVALPLSYIGIKFRHNDVQLF